MTSILLALLLQAQPAAVDGVYTMCEDVAGYSGETVELKAGKFRYWFYSDVSSGKEPSYPLTGIYTVNGATLTLDHADIHSKDRTLAVVNGVRVLWRKDGLELWQKEKRLHPYAVLLFLEGVKEGSARPKRPSLDLLTTQEMRDRDKKEHEERYGDLPAEAKVLFRARTMEGDPNMDTYKTEIGKARTQPDPKLVAQLIGLSNSKRDGIQAQRILSDLYGPSFLIKDPPPFVKDPAARKRALGTLIDGLSSAQDRYCLQGALLVFLRASDTHEIDLEVPEAGITVRLSVQGQDGYRSDSQGTQVGDTQWKKVIDKLIPACQKWMRAQLPP